MTREEAIGVIKSECYVFNPLNLDMSTRINTALDMAIQAMEQEPCEDVVSRQAAIDAIEQHKKAVLEGLEVDEGIAYGYAAAHTHLVEIVRNLPSAQPEPLTDKEQRIFLAAMGREEKVCEEVDRNYVREPYEDSLMRVCKEIRRKVKDALWT